MFELSVDTLCYHRQILAGMGGENYSCNISDGG
jgi:hypothetical protein